jgi:hypothetical protein
METKKHFLSITFLLLFHCSSDLLQSQSREGSAFDQSKFVPDIACILDVSGIVRNIADQEYYSLTIPGFSFPFLNQPNTSGLNAHRGINFNYGELSLYSVVDPYFDLFAVLDLAPENAGLEEAYFTTRKLPYGLNIKAGKFLSSFGRVNEQHEHYWDFANRPLIATALFGEDGLNEIGIHATWVAPTFYFLVFGAEVMNGTNEQSFGTTGFNDPQSLIAVNAVQGPNLYVGFIRSSFDIEDASILLGISNATGSTRNDQGYSKGMGNAVDASTDIIAGDLTVKYSLDATRFVSFQSEYMYRVMNGTEYTNDSVSHITNLSRALDKHNSGFYAQVAAKFDQCWEIGFRYDLLMQNDVILNSVSQHMPSDLPRYSAMIEYNPTEFSRLRFQIDSDMSRYAQVSGELASQPYTQIILQANLIIGAHGAHAF